MRRIILCLIIGAIAAAPEAGAQSFARILTGPPATNPGINSFGVNWVDYDDDGWVDIFVTRWADYPNTNRLYRNERDGTFTRIGKPPLTSGSFSAGATWGDYDDDGDLDCFLANYVDIDNVLFRSEGPPDYEFAQLTEGSIVNDGGISLGASWIDYDLDGTLDLSVANFGEGIFLYEGLGGDSFARQTSSAIEAVPDDGHTGCVWGDIDNDGDSDLLVTVGTFGGYSGENRLFRNEIIETGAAGFTRITTDTITRNIGDHSGATWVDLDNDGDLDCFMANWMNSSPDELYRNEGGSFVSLDAGGMTTDSLSSFMGVWGDFDNDGDPDGYVTNDSGSANRYYRNDGNETFSRITGLVFDADIDKSWGVAMADYDNDGDLDLYVANERGPKNYLYRNDTDNGNHWISIDLEGGAHTHRSAFGSRIKVLAAIDGTPVWQIREVQSHFGVSCQNDHRAHFGLGSAASIDSLVVLWPSGAITTQGPTAADQFLLFIEPVVTGVDGAGKPAIPLQSEPNPFRTRTLIRYNRSSSGNESIDVFDIRGRLIRSLRGEEGSSPGVLVWDGQDAAGRRVAPGTYFLRLGSERGGAVRKVVIIR